MPGGKESVSIVVQDDTSIKQISSYVLFAVVLCAFTELSLPLLWLAELS
jgi:hypothetical protein